MPTLSASSLAVASAGVLGAAALGTMGLFGGNQLPVEGKTVLITGASEGLGRSAARQLAEQGANVIVVARNTAKLQEVVGELKAAAKTPSSQRFHHIAADVSEPGYGAALLAAATAWNGGRTPDVVWQVAGMSTPLLWTDEAALAACRRNMDVNFWGAAELAHAVFRAWTSSSSSPAPPPRSPPRQLIFTASSAAFFAVAGYGPYSPSKWAMRALADTLAQEALLFPNHPVRVRVVYPGTTLSPGFERENTTKPAITTQLEKDDPRQTPDEAAASILKGLRAGHHYVTVSYLGELMRLGVLGGSIRNNWVYDIIGAWIAALAWIFVQPFIHGEIRGFAKKHGHPDTYAKKT